jgi:hypothetical protein
MASIKLDDAIILPHAANLMDQIFRKGQGPAYVLDLLWQHFCYVVCIQGRRYQLWIIRKSPQKSQKH